jgi:hypothetical protein
LRCFLTFALLCCAASASIPCCGCGSSPAKPGNKPLTGSLNVLVRPPDRTVEPVELSSPGALPIQSGGAMIIDVELSEPAFIYLIWINAAGEILPLYPWNNETLEVTDIQQPPPTRRATKRIFSPLLGRSWTFGNQNGAETVVLLCRRTAWPQNVKLELLWQPPPTTEFEHPNDFIEFKKTQHGSNSGGKESAVKFAGITPKAAALARLLHPLLEHFEFAQVVQFAHDDKNPAQSPENSR